MKIVIAIILIIILIAVIIEIYFIFSENKISKLDLAELSKKLETFQQENERLKAEIQYFSIPENLEKELRTKFNYRKPNEKMMIIVP